MHLEGGIVDLQQLALSSGQARSLELKVPLAEVHLGGQDYAPKGGAADAILDVSRTTTGHALRLRFTSELDGPCVRCLEPAHLEVAVDAREVDQPTTDDEELRSPYVEEARLDLARWANDAMVLALPSQPLCREGCLGLCPDCGESLNDADPADHRHGGTGDPRMAKLRDLKLE